MHQIIFVVLLLVMIVERLLELRSAKSNTAHLLAVGGREFGEKHFIAIVVMHVAFFVSLITEFMLRGEPIAPNWWIPAMLLVVGQSLRLWSRRTMSGRWTTRIIVVPNEHLIARGPYRYFRHPIYIAVALELFSLPLIFGMYVTMLLFSILNALMLLLVRIPEEDRALAWSQNPQV